MSYGKLATVDIVIAQAVGLSGADDPSVLEWAAQHERVLLTHDASTVTRHAYDRVKSGAAMPGVFEVGQSVSIGLAIDEIILITECSLPGEWEGQVRYLPLR